MEKEIKNKPQNYRGIKPAELVLVLEGDGTTENPWTQTNYVIVHEFHDGISRMRTIGKVVPLTEEEKNWFGR